MLMELADFFDTSVDVLLGYEMKDNRLAASVARIKQCRREKDRDGFDEAEKALKKYPNVFDVAYNSAVLYSSLGIECGDKPMLLRAMELLRQSLLLIAQNTDPKINESTIHGVMAEVLLCLGDAEQAVEMLKKHNAAGMYNDIIGMTLASHCKRKGEALPLIHYADNVNNAANWTGDGTLRNKCIVGHRRGSIYAANLIVCIAAGAMLCAAYIVPHTGFALMLLGGFEAEAAAILMYTAISLATICVFASLRVLVAMLCPNKAYTAALCILLAFALLFAGVYITSALNEPEYYQGFSYTENGVTASEEMERNPNYLSGAKRQVYEFMYDFVRTPLTAMCDILN